MTQPDPATGEIVRVTPELKALMKCAAEWTPQHILTDERENRLWDACSAFARAHKEGK